MKFYRMSAACLQHHAASMQTYVVEEFSKSQAHDDICMHAYSFSEMAAPFVSCALLPMQELDPSWPLTATKEEVVLKDLATQLLASLKRLATQMPIDEAQPAPWAALVSGMQGQQSCGRGQLARDKVIHRFNVGCLCTHPNLHAHIINIFYCTHYYCQKRQGASCKSCW